MGETAMLLHSGILIGLCMLFVTLVGLGLVLITANRLVAVPVFSDDKLTKPEEA